MLRELGGILLLTVATSSGFPQQPPSCICPFNYAPVCGSDGTTYGNDCGLHCAQKSKPNLILKSRGPCVEKPACLCPQDLTPVCGVDGVTYDNECAMGCLGVEKRSDGECEKVKVASLQLPTCTCTRNYKPVCGTDGQTYNNDCLLMCSTSYKPELRMHHQGKCETVNVVDNRPDNCACDRNLRPVCGTDGETYPNLCQLNCAQQRIKGLLVKHNGVCTVAREQ